VSVVLILTVSEIFQGTFFRGIVNARIRGNALPIQRLIGQEREASVVVHKISIWSTFWYNSGVLGVMAPVIPDMPGRPKSASLRQEKNIFLMIRLFEPEGSKLD
jgi:hypothetical protein